MTSLHQFCLYTYVESKACSYKGTNDDYICKTLENGEGVSICIEKEKSLTIQGQEAMIYIMNMAQRPIKNQDLDGRKITWAKFQDTRHIPGKF